MNQKERMEAELPYKAWMDGLKEERLNNQTKVFHYNQCAPEEEEKRDEMIRGILGRAGEDIHVESPFYCDYGVNIEVGDHFYSNYNLTILDVGKVKIGNNVMIASNVGIYTAGHPIHPESRNSGYEYGIGITIGDNVWIGGHVVVNPGITIGNNAVIGSGSVITRDIPDNAVVVGNPGRVIRYITEEDREYYFKKRKFDVEDYK